MQPPSGHAAFFLAFIMPYCAGRTAVGGTGSHCNATAAVSLALCTWILQVCPFHAVLLPPALPCIPALPLRCPSSHLHQAIVKGAVHALQGHNLTHGLVPNARALQHGIGVQGAGCDRAELRDSIKSALCSSGFLPSSRAGKGRRQLAASTPRQQRNNQPCTPTQQSVPTNNTEQSINSTAQHTAGAP